jgi:hypothetical protein
MSVACQITPTSRPVTSKLDQRTRTARRIAQLIDVYSRALGVDSWTDLPEIKKQMVEDAASLQAIAEALRERFLSGGNIPADDVVRSARVASLAVKRLGIRAQAAKPASSLPLAQRLMQAEDAT